MDNKVREVAERYAVLSVALFLMAMGISFSIRAGLGITPISCPPYVFSLHPGWLTVGQFTILMHIIFVAAQVIIRGKEFPKIQYLQLVMGTVFGCFMDLTNWLTQSFVPDSYPMQLLFVLIGTCFVAVGVVLQVTAKAMLIAGEGIMLTLANLWHVPFSKVKMGFDISLVVIGVVCSLIFYGEIKGVREGTVIAAVLVGFLAGKIQPLVGAPVAAWLNRHNVAKTEQTRSTGDGISVITIARGFGSGGHEIGKALADELGWTFVDQQLIDANVGSSGLDVSYISSHDQQMTEGERLWKFICGDNIQDFEESLSPEDRLFVAQGKAIRNIAAKGNCVIVGRCANFFLKDEPSCLHVFVSASSQFAAKRVMDEFGYDAEKAAAEIQRINTSRATHYNYYTGMIWGDSNGYDVCLCSSTVGVKAVEASILAMVRTAKDK